VENKLNVFVNQLKAGVRLSLAGAQEKLPIFIKDNKIHITMNGASSSHILKTPTITECVCLIRKESASQIGDIKRFLQLVIERFAQDTGIKYTILEKTIVDMSDKIMGAAKETTEEFYDLYGESAVVKKINEVIQQSSKEKRMVFDKRADCD
jgi:hypothetical protein